MPSKLCLLKRLAACCLASIPEHRPDIKCVIVTLNTIASSVHITAKSERQSQMQYTPGVKKDDINNAQVASRKRLKILKEHGNSKAIMCYEILVTNDTILNCLKHNTPESGQHTDWLLNLVRNFDHALIEAYMYQTYLEKYLYSSTPCFLNTSALSTNTVTNPPTTAISAARVTYFVAFTRSKTEVSFIRKQVITVSTLTKRNTFAIPKVSNVLLLKSTSDEPYSHIPFGERQSFQGDNGGNKHELLSTKSHHKEAVPCIQQHDLVQEPLLKELFTENSILSNSTRYAKLASSCSHMSSVAEESFSFNNAETSQYPNEVYSNCIDIAELVFSLSDSSSISSMKIELAVPHVCIIASANLLCNNAKLFEYSCFAIALVAQRYDVSYLFCYKCCLYVCYQKSAWVSVVYQATFKHAGKLLYTTSFYSAYYRADGAHKFWFAQYTECTVYEAPNINSMYACKTLHVNEQRRSTHSNACWVNKLGSTKPKQPSMILQSLCTNSALCLHRGALFGQLSSKVLSDFNCNLTSHHFSDTSQFSCNQEQKPIYAKAAQHNLEVSSLDSYDPINQCSVSVASDEASTVDVLNLPLCQHKQMHMALLRPNNCTLAGELSTTCVTKHYSTLIYSDIKKQQTTASFKQYTTSTVQKQVVLSIQCSLRLCKCIYTQPVITPYYTCKPNYHQLCNAALCSGVAVVNSLRNGLLCSFGSYYSPKKQSIISTTIAQESVLDVPMLRMQDNLPSKDTTSCLKEIALANSCKNHTTDVCFKWHCTLPAEIIQDIRNGSRETMGQYENSTNLPVSVAFDGKESSNQETILKIKPTQINFNTTSRPAKNNNVIITRNSVKEASRKHEVMKCTIKLDEWLFLHTGKGFIHNSAFNLSLLLRFLLMLGKEWLHKLLIPTESCKSFFNQLTLVGSLFTTLYFQVTLCTDHESTKAMENFHHNIHASQSYTNASMLTPLLDLLQYEHRHFVTQCMQVNLCRRYNMYLFSVQTLTLISATRCVNQPPHIVFIAYNSQIRGSIMAEKLSGICEISQIDVQQKKSEWFGVSRIIPEILHQSNANFRNNGIQLKIHSSMNDCITKSIILYPSVDLQLAGAPIDDLHQLNSATNIDQCTCCMSLLTRNFKSSTSSTVRYNMLKTTKQILSPHQDEQSTLITITCNKKPPTSSRDAYVAFKKLLYCGPTMLLAGTCMHSPSHGYEKVPICALTKGTHSDQDKDHDTVDKQRNNKCVSQRKSKSCSTELSKQSRCSGSREVRRHKTDNNGSDKNQDDDKHDKKYEFTPAQLIFSSFLVVFIILLLLHIHLIWRCLPGSLFLQHTTKKHSCNDVTFNSQRFNVYSMSICQVITPGWIDNTCYHMSHSRPSFRVANGSTAIQVLPQDNLHFCKRQINIPNSKALASVSPQHGLCILHKLQLMIIIKRKSHRMQTRNSGIVTSQCAVAAVAAVSIIYDKRLQQTPRMKRMTPLLQHIYAGLNEYLHWRKLYTFCFTTAKSKLLVSCTLNHICLTSALDYEVVYLFYDENDAALYQLMKLIYTYSISNQLILQCNLFDETLENAKFSHYLSKPCCFFRQNVLQTNYKQLRIACTMHSNGNHNNSDQYSNNIGDKKCKIDETEYEKSYKTHSSAPGHYKNNDSDLTYFLLMLQLQVLYGVLYTYTLLIVWYLQHTFGCCNDVVAFEIRSKEKRYPLGRVVLIERMAYHSYPMVNLKSRFPSQVVLDYFHGGLHLYTHYEPFNAYSNHFMLQNLDINVAHCQVITSISTDKRLYFISQGKGLQQWLIFILKGTVVILVSYCAMNYQARNTANKFCDVKSTIIYTLQLQDSDVINRVLFSRTYRYIFHIEGTLNIPRHSILEMHTPTIQWLSSFSRHDSRIPYQSINDCVHFKRQLYSAKTSNHMAVSELPDEPDISYCLQESTVDASESLHFTNTIKIVSTENRVDMFRPIGKLASGCTISYYSNQGMDDMDMYETWQLVIGNVTLYHASGSQTLQNEHHHDAIINGNDVNAIVNFGVEALQNVDAFMPPEKEVDLDDDFHLDNLIVS